MTTIHKLLSAKATPVFQDRQKAKSQMITGGLCERLIHISPPWESSIFHLQTDQPLNLMIIRPKTLPSANLSAKQHPQKFWSAQNWGPKFQLRHQDWVLNMTVSTLSHNNDEWRLFSAVTTAPSSSCPEEMQLTWLHREGVLCHTHVGTPAWHTAL